MIASYRSSDEGQLCDQAAGNMAIYIATADELSYKCNLSRRTGTALQAETKVSRLG